MHTHKVEHSTTVVGGPRVRDITTQVPMTGSRRGSVKTSIDRSVQVLHKQPRHHALAPKVLDNSFRGEH